MKHSEEARAKQVSLMIFSLTVLLLVIISFFVYDYYESHKTMDFYESQDCKREAWIDCGLKWSNDSREMCYQTADNVEERWKKCQVISFEERDCWIERVEKCKEYYDRWIEKNQTKEKLW